MPKRLTRKILASPRGLTLEALCRLGEHNAKNIPTLLKLLRALRRFIPDKKALMAIQKIAWNVTWHGSAENLPPLLELLPDLLPHVGEEFESALWHRAWNGALQRGDALLYDHDTRGLSYFERYVPEWNCEGAPGALEGLAYAVAKHGSPEDVRSYVNAFKPRLHLWIARRAVGWMVEALREHGSSEKLSPLLEALPDFLHYLNEDGMWSVVREIAGLVPKWGSSKDVRRYLDAFKPMLHEMRAQAAIGNLAEAVAEHGSSEQIPPLVEVIPELLPHLDPMVGLPYVVQKISLAVGRRGSPGHVRSFLALFYFDLEFCSPRDLGVALRAIAEVAYAVHDFGSPIHIPPFEEIIGILYHVYRTIRLGRKALNAILSAGDAHGVLIRIPPS